MDEWQAYLRSLVVGANTPVPLITGECVTAINFDNAATTPPFQCVLQEINEFAPWYSSVHRGAGYKSVYSSNLYEEGREAVKKFVNADRVRDVVIYTKNTTEALNLLAYTLAQKNQEQMVLATDMEHLANDLPWRDKFTICYAAIDAAGRLSLEDVEKKLIKYQGKIKLVTVTGASNVTGYINPIYTIAGLAHKYGAKIVVDGAQLVPHCPVDMKNYDVPEHIDYLTFSAHKMYAPFGVGILIAPKETFAQCVPLLKGGGAIQLVTHDFIDWEEAPYKEEAGTPNLMGIVALLTAIKTLTRTGMQRIHEYEKGLIHYAIAGLKSIEGLEVYCSTEPKEDRISTISFNLPGIHHGQLARMLSFEGGIAVRNGLFCAHPYVEKLLQLSPADIKYFQSNEKQPFPGLVRISFGLYNNYQEIDRFLCLLQDIASHKEQYNKKYSRIANKRENPEDLLLYPIRGNLP